MAKKIGVVLSGCGVYDGAEIHESVVTLLSLTRAGAEIVCMAPNVDQMHVINHLTGDVAGETRNVLMESARIARGDVKDVAAVSASDLDGLVLPGGFGAAKNLCDFATKGVDCTVNPDVERLVRDMHKQGKVVAAICIAPALLSKVFAGSPKVKLTIGTDPATAQAIEAMGNTHIRCAVDACVVDEENKVVTTPAYMLAQNVAEAASGIEKLISEVMRRA